MSDLVKVLRHHSPASVTKTELRQAAELIEQQQREIESKNKAAKMVVDTYSKQLEELLGESQKLAAHVERCNSAMKNYISDCSTGQRKQSTFNLIRDCIRESPQTSLAEHNSEVAYNAIKFCLSEIARDNSLDEYNPTNDAKVILESYEK